MKLSVSILLLLFCYCMDLVADNVFGKIDERLEFTSIAFRLAGKRQYQDCRVVFYENDIEAYFVDYKNHPLISFISENRNLASPEYALNLEIKDGRVSFVKSKFTAINTENDSLLARYELLLDSFYRDTRFHVFFEKHENLYLLAEANFRKACEYSIDTAYLRKMFGLDTLELPQVYINITNGGSCFAVPGDNPALIMGGFEYVDWSDENIAKFGFYNYGFTDLLVHEWMHVLIDDIACQYVDSIMQAAKVICKKSDSKYSLIMDYGSIDKMWNEWLTRFATMKYIDDNNNRQRLYNVVREDVDDGFIWQPLSYKLLEYYDKDIVEGRVFNDFLPHLTYHLNIVAKNFDEIKLHHEEKLYIKNIYPTPGSVIDLSLFDSLSFEFEFSENMFPRCAVGVEHDDCFDIYNYSLSLDGDKFKIMFPVETVCNCSKVSFTIYSLDFISESFKNMENDITVHYSFINGK